jgi:glycosyltransferase involved in cell wall biosynthesis
MNHTRVVVLGMMGRTPFAGVAWQVLHYLEAFRRLGCDVSYVEDTGDWPYDAERNTITDDVGYTVDHLAGLLEWVGLTGSWAYVAPGGEVHGLLRSQLNRLLAQADILVNLTGATVLREEHLAVPVRIYLETDPVLPQIEVALEQTFTIELLAGHTHHFSFGENLGAPDCGVPLERFAYLPTRQPVVLDWWRSDTSNGSSPRFTTVANWRQSGKDVDWQGTSYSWSKHVEFLKVVDLPRITAKRLELALACDDQLALETLAGHGWRVVDGLSLSRQIDPYREYIRHSHAEFTVAKDQNVRLRSGWFSDRSACYLAAGKPVVTQDTGFGNILPVGEGLFAFSTLDDAAAALEEVERDYVRHSRAARELAAEYFDASRVVGKLLVDAGV